MTCHLFHSYIFLYSIYFCKALVPVIGNSFSEKTILISFYILFSCPSPLSTSSINVFKVNILNIDNSKRLKMDNSEKLTKPSNEHCNTKKTACYEISKALS